MEQGGFGVEDFWDDVLNAKLVQKQDRCVGPWGVQVL